ncbi:sigma-70 family RNA polymerase sigma factor [Pontibacter sp. 13R65]|uniref:sigma-70 family RNA polymerase sigma factor n=1 Tax=Pontibacter sp. 13R65 TaxID=3127458 RepID=UPI00301CCC68
MVLTDIWEQVQEDSEEAFQLLFELQWKRCFALSYALLRHKEQAEDLVQEIFMDLWERRKTLLIRNPEAFLTQMIKNKAFTILSKTKIPERNIALLEQLHQELSPEDVYLFDELNTQVKNIITKLPPRSKEVFVLRKFEDLSVDDIASKLDLSIRTVEHHLYLATKFLKSKLTTISLLLLFAWPI